MNLLINIGATDTKITRYESTNIDSENFSDNFKTHQLFSETYKSIVKIINENNLTKNLENIIILSKGMVSRDRSDISKCALFPDHAGKNIKSKFEQEFNVKAILEQNVLSGSLTELEENKDIKSYLYVHMLEESGAAFVEPRENSIY
ncbi:MAG: ROK family protein [Candidatus Dojkabacteria bacterium]|nr:ROK family protein [Candidatus Dojkabacteria bacterium]MDQ7020545.1 ROK family protein [Candidatus Dojkabacteria bacterium]